MLLCSELCPVACDAVPSAAIFGVGTSGRVDREFGTCRTGAPIGARCKCTTRGIRSPSDGAASVMAVSSSSPIRPIVLAVSCLILGFVGGWALATVGGDEVALPDANVDVTVEQPAPRTTTVAPKEAAPPARSAVVVKVLNGTSRAGLAATTATTLTGLGYTKVTAGNTTSQTGPTVVYYRKGAKPAADQLAKDLQSETVTPLDGTALAQSAGADTQLVVVLGA